MRKAITGNDTITANNEKEVLNLFDKTMFGGMKIPYNISTQAKR